MSESTVFAPRALKRARDSASITEAYARGWIDVAELSRQFQVRRLLIEYLERGGLAERGSRRMPSVKKIAKHHRRPWDQCWRCGQDGFVVRAHLVDRVFGGLDAVQNLGLLCEWCHRVMPIFEPGDDDDAVAYVFG